MIQIWASWKLGSPVRPTGTSCHLAFPEALNVNHGGGRTAAPGSPAGRFPVRAAGADWGNSAKRAQPREAEHRVLMRQSRKEQFGYIFCPTRRRARFRRAALRERRERGARSRSAAVRARRGRHLLGRAGSAGKCAPRVPPRPLQRYSRYFTRAPSHTAPSSLKGASCAPTVTHLLARCLEWRSISIRAEGKKSE